MKTISVEIEGKGLGILLHNPAGMGQSGTGKRATSIPTPEAEARAGCYWTEDGKSLAIPAWNVFRALVNAAAAYKDGRTSGSRIVAAGITVEPPMLSFNTDRYEIDVRRVKLPRGGGGILRSRPLLKNWRLSFDLLVNEEDLSPKFFPTLRNITEDCGRTVGLGDFRLATKGPFGKFVVTRWEVS